MKDADANGDDRLDQDEYMDYLQYMKWSLYVVPTGTLSNDTIKYLFETLVEVSGDREDENGKPQIDIYGAHIDDVS